MKDFKLNIQDDQEFEQFLRAKVAEAKSAVAFPGTTFLKMLGADGGYKTARSLLSRPHPSDGFTNLLMKGRADLTVEALVVESRWRAFFAQNLVLKAEELLRKSGYKFVPFVVTPPQLAPTVNNDQPKPSSTGGQLMFDNLEISSNLSAFDDLDAPPGNTIPSRTVRLVSGYKRDPAIRRAVMARARGACEYCRTPGFELPDGTLYLEAHHVIGLAQDGPDTMANVIALCAHHHKQAHYGRDAAALEEEFLDILTMGETA